MSFALSSSFLRREPKSKLCDLLLPAGPSLPCKSIRCDKSMLDVLPPPLLLLLFMLLLLLWLLPSELRFLCVLFGRAARCASYTRTLALSSSSPNMLGSFAGSLAYRALLWRIGRCDGVFTCWVWRVRMSFSDETDDENVWPLPRYPRVSSP